MTAGGSPGHPRLQSKRSQNQQTTNQTKELNETVSSRLNFRMKCAEPKLLFKGGLLGTVIQLLLKNCMVLMKGQSHVNFHSFVEFGLFLLYWELNPRHMLGKY